MTDYVLHNKLLYDELIGLKPCFFFALLNSVCKFLLVLFGFFFVVYESIEGANDLKCTLRSNIENIIISEELRIMLNEGRKN